ncbi:MULTISPECIES: phage head closure protein [Pseudomonas]|uniref:phage head closure protein n=1 Tax=Pseudomonas TaxID=286 RepID=UPI0025974FFE|nr:MULTISPECIES: phage head closure protein [Pseudomonas]
MRAGTLRHRITIQAPGQGQDPATGEMVQGQWVDVAAVYASIEPLSGREFIASQASQSEVTVRIVIRYRPGISTQMRLVYQGLIYNIEGILADKHSGREYLTLMCSGGINEG